MSFFSSSSKKSTETKSEKSVVIPTGGEIDGMVAALCVHANDADAKVRRTISDSLIEIGRKQPNLILSSSLDLLKKDLKSEQRHRIILLKVIEQILSFARAQMQEELGLSMIELCMSDMTREKEVLADWQGAASSVLVSLGLRWPDIVMEKLMAKFAPGTIPHYFVMKTLGDFAHAYPLATVPHLKGCLARILPVLASIKHDNLKWVFASSMWKFCDAIVTYVVDIEDAPDKSLTLQSFSGEIFPAYELIFNNWLSSKEEKVRAATVQAVGAMCALLTPVQFEQQLPKIIQGMLGLYKKDKEHVAITMGMCTLLEVAVRDQNRVLAPHLNVLLSAFHTLVCIPIDHSSPNSVKNNNELMRCFGIMSLVFCEEVVTFLLGRLDPRVSKLPKDRIGTLEVLKHLVTRLGSKMGDSKGLIVSGIQPMARSETVVRVKKALAQLVITMASHDYLSLEGGTSAVEFIVTNSALTDADIQAALKKEKKPQEEEDSLEELRNICDNVLNLVTTTIPCMEQVLWPYLLELVIPGRFTGAVAILSKCVAHLAAKKRHADDEDYLVDFTKQVNVPKPPELVARFLVMMSSPLRRGRVGLHILQALHALGPVLHPSISAMWDNAVPRLASYLQSNSEGGSWDASAWEELVLRLLSETIKVVGSEEWTMQLGDALFTQLPTYETDPELKKTCYKHLGLVIQKLTKKDYIHNKLEAIFQTVNHAVEAQRLGCAMAFGYASASHLDIVLEKVNSYIARDAGKKPSSGGGLLSMFGSSSSDTSKAFGTSLDTNLLAFGYIAAYASPSLITTRIDVHILNNMKPHMTGVKRPERKEVIIKALDLIGKAMHPNHLGAPYVLKQRDELITTLLTFLMPEKEASTKPHPQVTTLGLNALATFIDLQPPLPDTLLDSVLEKACTFLKVSAQPEKEEHKDKEKTADTNSDFAKAIPAILSGVNAVLTSALSMDNKIPCLHRIFQVLRRYTQASEAHQRERAAESVLALLKKFVELKNSDPEAPEKREKLFSHIGADLGFMIPRCTDPILAIRQRSIEAVGIMLYIDHMLRSSATEEEGYNMQPPSVLRPLNGLRDRIAASALNEQYAVMQELSLILAQLVSPEELPEMLRCLFPGLTDSQLSSASGTCVVLNGLIKARGKELGSRVAELVSALTDEMGKITHEQTLNATLHAIRNLATHHTLPVIDQLLAVPVPHPPVVVKSFQVIAKDADLVMVLVDHLTHILNHTILMEEKGVQKKTYDPLPLPMSATCALGEIMQAEELTAIVKANYPLFAGSILLRFGTCTGMGQAIKQITDTFRQFMDCAKENKMKQIMEERDNWKRLQGTEYHLAITDIASAIGQEHGEEVTALFKFLFPFLKGNYIGHRIVAAVVLAEFVNHTQGNEELLHNLINALLLILSDDNIRLYALNGLANIVSAGRVMVDRYATTVLDALVTNIILAMKI